MHFRMDATKHYGSRRDAAFGDLFGHLQSYIRKKGHPPKTIPLGRSTGAKKKETLCREGGRETRAARMLSRALESMTRRPKAAPAKISVS